MCLCVRVGVVYTITLASSSSRWCILFDKAYKTCSENKQIETTKYLLFDTLGLLIVDDHHSLFAGT